MKIYVTGYSGFVGSRLMQLALLNDNEFEKLSLRQKNISTLEFTDCHTIIHLAGMAHQMSLKSSTEYDRVNAKMTRELAVKAKACGVRHFIFISTAKVFGEESELPYNELSACDPHDDYGKSKLNGEEAIRALHDESFIVSIVRPPLVYGPGVKGNMISLLKLANLPLPLPLKNEVNRRTIVFVDNLIQLIFCIADRKQGGLFLAGDSMPVSTGELIKDIREAMSNNYSVFNMPGLLGKALQAFRPSIYKRLFGNFVVDNTQTNEVLEYKNPYTTKQGIQTMVNWFLMKKSE